MRDASVRTQASRGHAGMLPASAPFNPYPFYAFRIWYGMVGSAWLSLLLRNRFAVSPARIAVALIGTVTAILNSILGAIQNLIFAKSIKAAVLDEPPIF